jgi:hypothetical protein
LIAVATTRLGNAEDHKKILKLPTIIDVFVYMIAADITLSTLALNGCNHHLLNLISSIARGCPVTSLESSLNMGLMEL